jgi:hypothetical protein
MMMVDGNNYDDNVDDKNCYDGDDEDGTTISEIWNLHCRGYHRRGITGITAWSQ